MNILVLKNPLESTAGGGGEIHTLQVARHLRARGHQIFFAGTCPHLLAMARAENFPTEEIPWAGTEAVSEKAILKFFFTWPSIKKHYREFLLSQKEKNKIELLYIISWNEKFLLGPIAKELGLKLIFIEHKPLSRFIRLNPFKAWYLKNSRQAINIAVSETVRQGMLEVGVPAERIKLIYNGIDPQEFSLSPAKRLGKTIGTIARLDREKGLEYLILALKKIKHDFPEVKLEIVGVGPEEQSLRQLVRESKLEQTVTFRGKINRQAVASFLAGIDIFALPATKPEAFGIVFAEAGYMRLPVVTTNFGAAKEIIINEQTGILTPPRDSDTLARALAKLLRDKDLRQRLGEAAHERIAQNFTLDKMLIKITRIIESK